MKKIVLSTLVVLGLSSAAFAQATAPDFVTVDSDVSGSVSFEEAQAAWPELIVDAFAGADADANGELSAEEYAALIAAVPAPAAM